MCYKSVESVHNVNKNAQIWMSFKGPKSRGGAYTERSCWNPAPNRLIKFQSVASNYYNSIFSKYSDRTFEEILFVVLCSVTLT